MSEKEAHLFFYKKFLIKSDTGDLKNGKTTYFVNSIVLKKISIFVKNIIFDSPNISRSEILKRIFWLLDDPTDEKFSLSNSKNLANIRRRVYDSLNVLIASDIIKSQKVESNTGKDYQYIPKKEIKDHLLKQKAILRVEVANKITKKCKMQNILDFKETKFSQL